MTESEQKQMYRRLALCAHYNFTEGMRHAAALLDDVTRDADIKTETRFLLAQAKARLYAKIKEREAAPNDSPAIPPRELTAEQKAALTVRKEAWDKAMGQASSSSPGGSDAAEE